MSEPPPGPRDYYLPPEPAPLRRMTPEQEAEALKAYWAARARVYHKVPLRSGQHILHLLLTVTRDLVDLFLSDLDHH